MKRTKNSRRKHYTLTPEDFMSRQERRTLMKACRERAELDLMRGRMTWPVRWMLIDLALYSGLRVSELAALKLGDIHLNDSDPCIIVRHGKGDRKRTVYIDEKLRDHLRDHIRYKRTIDQSTEQDAPLFVGRNGHVPPITLQKSFKQAIQAAGLRSDLHMHTCRHTYATYLLKSTGNLRYVQKQLGHADIGMTALYADILPEENSTLANKIERDEI